MTEVSMPLGAISKTKHVDNVWHRNETWWNVTAFLCLASGVLFGIIGLLMTFIGHFIGADAIDSKIGTIFIVLFFPLTMFGAHALDKVSDAEKKRKRDSNQK